MYRGYLRESSFAKGNRTWENIFETYEFQVRERSIFVIGLKLFSVTTQVCCGRWDRRGAAVCL